MRRKLKDYEFLVIYCFAGRLCSRLNDYLRKNNSRVEKTNR